MQILFEFLPLVAFFVAYKFAGIYVATGVITTAVVLLTGYRVVRRQQLTTLQKLSAGLMLGFGGLTLLLHDDRFILMKPTAFYWLISAGLLASLFMSKDPVLQQLVGTDFKLSNEQWRRLTWAWILMSFAQGAANLYVAFNYSRDTWVTFKFVLLGTYFAFIIGQTVWIVMHAEDHEAPAGTPAPEKQSASQ
jgi:intracellular septation protein